MGSMGTTFIVAGLADTTAAFAAAGLGSIDSLRRDFTVEAALTAVAGVGSTMAAVEDSSTVEQTAS